MSIATFHSCLGGLTIGQDPVASYWATTSFTGQGFVKLACCAAHARGPSVFAYYVQDPQRYGVIEFDSKGRAIGMKEKPAKPSSRTP